MGNRTNASHPVDRSEAHYVSTFCQAPIESDVNVEMPRGCRTLNQMIMFSISKKLLPVFEWERSSGWFYTTVRPCRYCFVWYQ
jgi:hypothetical protein